MPADRLNAIGRRLLGPFGIVPITPFALAVFRALFGLGLLYILLIYQPITAKAVDVRRPHGPLADAEWIYALAVNHTAATMMQTVACLAAVLFIIGIYARLAYVIVVVLMFLNVLMILTRTGGHDWGLPIVTFILLTIVPWGETPSLMALRRSWRSFATPALASRVYGFAVWLPGLMIGLSFAAAAYAKVVGTGLEWITNGSVRYHFVEDGRNAPISLGLWIATHESVAVAFSLAAVVIEAVFILVIFARDWRVRLAFGLMGASLMAGFTLLQGVAWWPWRILFLAFLPWSLLTLPDASSTAPAHEGLRVRPRDLTWAHALLVAVVTVNQVWASWKVVEIEPLISNFPMYAYTWPSPEEFNRRQERTRFEANGVDISGRIEDAVGEDLLRGLAVVQHGAPIAESMQRDLAKFTATYKRMYGDLPPAIDVYVVQRQFDWQKGEYLPQTRERIGTVHF